MISAKRKWILKLKNLPGWRTRHRIVVFSIDDYGNVLLDSRQARENLRKAGLNVDGSRFSQYDALETAEDLEQLFDTLRSTKDCNGRPAVFTAFAMSANLDFETIAASGYETFHYELLPDTFRKRPGYDKAWTLWQQGMAEGIFVPEFHGREHLNVRFFETYMRRRDPEVMACLQNRSYAAISRKPDSRIGFTQAFSLDTLDELDSHKAIALDGLKAFERIFGRPSVHFNAPGAREHSFLEPTLREAGIRFIDTDIVKKEHQGNGEYKRKFRPFGSKNAINQTYLFRNCVFEPLLTDSAVDDCLTEIDIAFSMGKPANISSHRVNFGGHIEPAVRAKGLDMLRRLLQEITRHWPDVEFMSSVEMACLIG